MFSLTGNWKKDVFGTMFTKLFHLFHEGGVVFKRRQLQDFNIAAVNGIPLLCGRLYYVGSPSRVAFYL